MDKDFPIWDRRPPKKNCQKTGRLLFVSQNPLYTGRWWAEGGHKLWEMFAPDEVDRYFYIDQKTFWAFLILAQNLLDWYSEEDETPITWKYST